MVKNKGISESAGGVVVSPKGHVIVVNQRGRTWSLPKGHLDAGEDALTAAKREIHEEAGVPHLSLVKSLGSYERYKIALNGGDDKSELKKIHMFLFKTDQEKLEPIDPNHPEARWVNPDEVAALLTHPKDKEFFKSIRHLIS